MTIVNTPPAGNARRITRSLVSFGEQKDKKDALLLIENKDNLCLFKAVVVGIAYDEAPRKLGCKNFKKLLADDTEQTRRARVLMTLCGIADDLPEYGVDHLTNVQTELNRHYSGRYRLLVFSADNGEGKYNLETAKNKPSLRRQARIQWGSECRKVARPLARERPL